MALKGSSCDPIAVGSDWVGEQVPVGNGNSAPTNATPKRRVCAGSAAVKLQASRDSAAQSNHFLCRPKYRDAEREAEELESLVLPETRENKDKNELCGKSKVRRRWLDRGSK